MYIDWARIAGLYLAAFASACFGAEVRIHDIQGRAHQSPLLGQAVQGVPGVVTAMRPHGFYMQDPSPDEDLATSEAVFVFAPNGAAVAVGDAVLVSGTVTEFRPGGAAGENNLSSTNIQLATVTVVLREQPLPVPVELGVVPASTREALNFYEGLEAMRVRVPKAKVVAPANAAGELAVVSESARPEARFSPRGALLIDPRHANSQRLLLSRVLAPLPAAKVGDRLIDVTGIVDYAFGYYRLQVTAPPLWHEIGLEPEFATAAVEGQLSIASLNVENLNARQPAFRFDRIAAQIVRNLRSPDIVGLLEVQDNNGAIDDGTVRAGRTLKQLREAILRLGGPAYEWTQIDPDNNQDGGEPGANIRQVLLFDPARVRLEANPWRIAATNPAFLSSRKPLTAIFSFRERPFHVVLNHFVSKRGDESLFGLQQPHRLLSEPQRLRQAQAVAEHVRNLLARDAQARIVVMGDLNDFEFSPVMQILEEAGLVNPLLSLPEEERYSYIHEGNAQTLDHILVSPAISAYEYDIVHVNAEYPTSQRASDHDPVLIRLRLP